MTGYNIYNMYTVVIIPRSRNRLKSAISSSGLYKLFHPAILDGKTWSKFGEHGERGGHGKDGRHQPDDLKPFIHD